jgi:hypothetical protein
LKKNINPRLYRGFFSLKSLVITGAVALSLGFFISCNEYDSIGLDLIDNPLQFSSTDTISLVAYTRIDDSLSARNADLHLLGFLNDPIFGKTKGSIYAEALPALLNIKFGIPADSLVIDSVMLLMTYAGYVGDTTITQTVRVFELAAEIPVDSIYANQTIPTRREVAVNNPSFLPKPKSRVFLGTDTVGVTPHLRISLDKSFGVNFIRTVDSLQAINKIFSTAQDYRNFFKGFLITVDEVEQPGAMLYFNLYEQSYSKLQIFYRKTGAEKGSLYEIRLNNQTARRYTHFDSFEHAFVSNDIKAQIFDVDTLLGDSILFVQGMGNFSVKIQLPYINKLRDDQSSDFAINSARLIIPIDTSFELDSVDIARSLILYREVPGSPGKLTYLSDQFVASGYFGGGINDAKKEYSFNIAQHLQLIMDDPSLNTPLYLKVNGAIQNAQRIVLKGPQRGEKSSLRLEIKYTQPVTN